MATGDDPLSLEVAGVRFQVNRIEWRLPEGTLPEGGYPDLVEALRARYPGAEVSLIVERSHGDRPWNPLPPTGRGDATIIAADAADRGLLGRYPPGELVAMRDRARRDVRSFVEEYLTEHSP